MIIARVLLKNKMHKNIIFTTGRNKKERPYGNHQERSHEDDDNDDDDEEDEDDDVADVDGNRRGGRDGEADQEGEEKEDGYCLLECLVCLVRLC